DLPEAEGTACPWLAAFRARRSPGGLHSRFLRYGAGSPRARRRHRRRLPAAAPQGPGRRVRARRRRVRTGAIPEQGGLPVAADKRTRGLLLVYTGHGKGKTTAALGIVFRALGRGLRVAVVQFIKGKWKTGERLFAEKLPGLTFLVMGRGFTWESEDLSR